MDAFKDEIADGMAHSLLPRAPRIWAESKLNGMNAAQCDMGRVQVCHGLLRPAFDLSCKVNDSGQTKSALRAEEDVVDDHEGGAAQCVCAPC